MEASGAEAESSSLERRVGHDGKRRRKRTEAEKEERRKRKETEAAAAAAGSPAASTATRAVPQVLSVHDNASSRPDSAVSSIDARDVPGVGDDGRRRPASTTGMPHARQTTHPPGITSAAATAPEPAAAWGVFQGASADLEAGGDGGGARGGPGGGPSLSRQGTLATPDGRDIPAFVPPSYAVALKHAKAVNVHRQRAGVAVHMNDDALAGLTGDEILADIYAECERRGIVLHRVTKDGKSSAVIEDVPTSSATDLAQTGVTVQGRVCAGGGKRYHTTTTHLPVFVRTYLYRGKGYNVSPRCY